MANDTTQFKTLDIAAVIKKAWSWQRDIYVDQWNRVEKPEVDPCRYSDRDAKAI